MATETEAEHERRSEDKEFGAISRRENGVLNVLNPAICAQLDRADQGMRDEQHKQQWRADRPTTGAAKPQQYRPAHRRGDIKPGASHKERVVPREAGQQWSQTVFEEQKNKEPDNDCAQDADVAEHFTQAEAFLGRFGFRKMLAEE